MKSLRVMDKINNLLENNINNNYYYSKWISVPLHFLYVDCISSERRCRLVVFIGKIVWNI